MRLRAEATDLVPQVNEREPRKGLKYSMRKSSFVMESGCLHDLRSRNVQEDCIKYYLFIIDDTVTYCEQREILQEVCREAKHLTDSLLRDYVWQREGFSVNLAEVAGIPELLKEESIRKG